MTASLPRTLFVCVLLNATAAYVAARPAAGVTPQRQPLDTIAMTIDGWTGARTPGFDARTLDVLGVDDYLSRVYVRNGDAVGLYVGYYGSQSEGDVIHSPMNCLPGAGWQPVATGRLTIALGNALPRAIEVNRVLIQKGDERQLVLYWYQSHGRTIASEYVSKVVLVVDAIRLNRTDAALVRVTVPIDRGTTSIDDAEARAVSFVRALFPHLGPSLPA